MSATDTTTGEGDLKEQRLAARIAITESARFDRPFFLSNLAATVIAGAGLIGNSTATTIGAMLVATLMGPIMGVGLALVDFDNRLLRQALGALIAGALMVLAVGVALGFLFAPEITPTSEMLSRTSPRLADLVVGLTSGAVCAYAATVPRLNAALVGVSIAVALVPPLTTAGLFAARADWEQAGGASLLAFVNMVAIQVGASVALWLRGFRGRPLADSGHMVAELGRHSVSLILIAALAVSLGYHGVRLQYCSLKALSRVYPGA